MLSPLLSLLLVAAITAAGATKPVITCNKAMAFNMRALACLSLSLPLGCFPPTSPAFAAIDCNEDCVSNCNRVAPGSRDYCKVTCTEYCAQTDRQDGLSGSIDASKGETGIFGGSIDGTVRRGDDRPPSLVGVIPKETMKSLQLKAPEQPYRKGVYWKDVLAPKE